MAIDNRFSESFDLNAIDNVEDLGAIVRELKPKIGFFGGRKFSYQDKISYRLNDIVKRFVFLSKKTLTEKGKDLTAIQALHINVIHHEIEWLDNLGLALERKNSKLKRFLTHCSQFFGNLFIFGNIDYRIAELSKLSIPFRSQGFSFKKGNETLSNIDRNTLIEILESLVKKRFYLDFYIFGNHDLHPVKVIQLIPTLKLDKNKPRERELLLQFAKHNIGEYRCTSLQFKAITFDGLVKLGFDPQVDRQTFIDLFLQYVKERNRPEKVIKAFRRLSVDPLEQEGLENWKKFINVCPQYYLKEFCKNLKGIVDPFVEEQLPTYIELLKCCLEKEDRQLQFDKIIEIAGLGTNSLQELKTLTVIIKSISEKGEEEKNVWQFIQKNGINGSTQLEQEYLQWLLGSINFNIHGALPLGKIPSGIDLSQLELLPFELLKQFMRKLDPSSLVTVLLSSKHSNIVNAAWLSLIAQDRSKMPKFEDFRDLINFSSPSSIIDQIINRLGPDVEELDLTGIFDFDLDKQTKHERQLEVLGKIFQACPRLRSLRMDKSGRICNKVADLFPISLLEIDFGDGLFFSNPPLKIPSRVKEVRMSFPFRSHNYVRTKMQILLDMLPGDLEKLIINEREGSVTSMKYQQVIDMIKKLSIRFKNLQVLEIPGVYIENLGKEKMKEDRFFLEIVKDMTWQSWNGKLRDLFPLLPEKITSFSFHIYNVSTKHDFEYLPKTLQNLRLMGFISTKEMGYIPEHIKGVSISNWYDDFQELLPFLPKNIETLTVKSILGRKFVDEDVEHLPGSLKMLKIVYGHSLLTKKGRKALKDRGIAFEELE